MSVIDIIIYMGYQKDQKYCIRVEDWEQQFIDPQSFQVRHEKRTSGSGAKKRNGGKRQNSLTATPPPSPESPSRALVAMNLNPVDCSHSVTWYFILYLKQQSSS